MKAHLICVSAFVLALAGCGKENDTKGVYVILELENPQDVNQYTIVNENLTLELCKKTAGDHVADILASAPDVVPKDSKIKSWRCSLVPPEKGG